MYASPREYIPQGGPIRIAVTIWTLSALGVLLFLALIALAPLAFALGYPGVGATIFHAFSFICHQIPERSFGLSSYPLAVCARCTGIYAGFAIGVIAYPALMSLRRVQAPDRKWLFLSCVPLALDIGLHFAGIWENTQASRLLTGALLGAVAAFFVLPGFLELGWRRSKRLVGQVDGKKDEGKISTVTDETLASAPSDYSSPWRRI